MHVNIIQPLASYNKNLTFHLFACKFSVLALFFISTIVRAGCFIYCVLVTMFVCMRARARARVLMCAYTRKCVFVNIYTYVFQAYL